MANILRVIPQPPDLPAYDHAVLQPVPPLTPLPFSLSVCLCLAGCWWSLAPRVRCATGFRPSPSGPSSASSPRTSRAHSPRAHRTFSGPTPSSSTTRRPRPQRQKSPPSPSPSSPLPQLLRGHRGWSSRKKTSRSLMHWTSLSPPPGSLIKITRLPNFKVKQSTILSTRTARCLLFEALDLPIYQICWAVPNLDICLNIT